MNKRALSLRNLTLKIIDRQLGVRAVSAYLCFAAFSSNASHASPAETAADAHSPTLQWIVETRNYWGKLIGDTGGRLDAFFAGEEIIEKTNNSFLKLSLESQFFKSGQTYLIPSTKFRLDLPLTEKRLRLAIESEPSEEQTIQEKKRAQASDKDDKERNRAFGALDVELKERRHWKTSTGVGLKFGVPMNPFWRARADGEYKLSEDWSLSSHDSVYYFHKTGWGTKAEVTFERKGPWFVFRQTTDGRYEYTDRRWELAHTYSFLREISAIRAINYQVGILGETQPEVQATGYFVHAIYRRKLHRDWLFYEMIPEVYYPKDDYWKMTPSLTFKIEIVLSSKE